MISVVQYDLPTGLLKKAEVSASVKCEPTYTQNGDAMRDPEIVFLVSRLDFWVPMTFQQDNLGLYQEAVCISDGAFSTNAALIRQRKELALMWNRNIAEQGYLSAFTDSRPPA